MPGYTPTIDVAGPIRAVGEPDRGGTTPPAAEETLWKTALLKHYKRQGPVGYDRLRSCLL
jgi:hypothetical protein